MTFSHFSFVAATVALATAATACSAQPAPAQAQPIAVSMAGCSAQTAGVVPKLRDRQKRIIVNRMAALAQDLKGPKADVLFFGDSILQRWPDAELQRAFPGQRVLELGIRGERVAELLYRVRGAIEPVGPGRPNPGLPGLAAQSPRRVIVMIGTNDLRGKSPCFIAQGTANIVSALRTLYPKARIVVLGILPRGNPQGQYADKLATTNAAVAATARTSRAFEAIDISARYRCKPQQACDVAIPKNYVHPSAKGYRVLSDSLRDALDRSR